MELVPLIGGIDFGEGPRWREGRLWYSDFYQQSVYTVTEDGHREKVVSLTDRPSGLGWLPNGDLLIVAMETKQLLRFDGEQLTPYADLAAFAPGPCNDMVVSETGHAYVGNFGFDFAGGGKLESTRLIHVPPDGEPKAVGEPLRFPNGSVITPDGKTLIVGETMGGQYSAYSIDDTGHLENAGIWASIPGTLPDGCCLDEEGTIWCSDAGPSQSVVRIAAGGEILERLPTPAPTYACMLGGDDGKTLFILTAPGPAEHEAAGKGLGQIWTTRVKSGRAGLP